MYLASGCNSPAMSAYTSYCGVFGSLLAGAGITYALMAAMLVVSALAFASAVGVALRASAHLHDDPTSKDYRARLRVGGGWLPGCASMALDWPSTLFFTTLLDAVLALVFLIAWPAALSSAISKYVEHLKTLAPIEPPTIPPVFPVIRNSYTTLTYVGNAMPGAGYFVVLGGVICIVWALVCASAVYFDCCCRTAKVAQLSESLQSNSKFVQLSPLNQAGAV